MKKLLSLPPNLVNCFHDITGLPREEWYCTNDPIGQKLGSGGGTAWLLEQCFAQTGWQPSERKILLHAGGQSRRLPAYAPSGKILTPIPVFRWERGQKLSQTLLDLQLPLYEQIMSQTPEGLNTMIVSGDVFIRATKPLQQIPKADVVCYGLWLSNEIAKDHGVFVMKRDTPNVLKCMLQKPSIEKLNNLLTDHYYLTDIGIWILSDRAVDMLCKKAKQDGRIIEYDMYSEFGTALGTNPTSNDEDLKSLSVAILPLPGGEFYHYGTSHEIISSTLDIQNITKNQEEILHNSRKPHPSIFNQNTQNEFKFTSANRNIWIENSHINAKWQLSSENIVTGVPENDWEINLKAEQCVDIIPVSEDEFVVRPYGFNDKFAGKLQSTPLFPACSSVDEAGKVLQFMLEKIDASKPSIDEQLPEIAELLKDDYRLLSAEQISNEADLIRLNAQRKLFRKENWLAIAENYEHSVFYQSDLDHAAKEFAKYKLPLP
ncbi:MAG: bifunctional fucokinase/L-fucose-1-P-guanylyltransferase, partial [Bacteroidaceae bacterium]|nr:bifunctional fucokinase/L-fucose-1-P-guanylyltransferase [Bacteroidaceae bacterium]